MGLEALFSPLIKGGIKDVAEDAGEVGARDTEKAGARGLFAGGAGAGAGAKALAGGAGATGARMLGGAGVGALNTAKNLFMTPADQGTVSNMTAPITAGANIGLADTQKNIQSITGADNKNTSIADAKASQSATDNADEAEQQTERHN